MSKEKGKVEKPVIEKTKKSKKGGKREGSGRKQTQFTILTMKERREYFVRYFMESGELEPILNSLFEAAKKNPKAAAYVLNQLIGSPIQGIELSGKDGGPVDFSQKTDDELRRIAEGVAGASAAGFGKKASH